MKKLKIILLFSFIIIFIFRLNISSKYNYDTNEIIGKIIECKEHDEYTKLIVKGKEKVSVTIYDNYTCNLGDIVKIKGTFKEIEENRNFNLFNYKKYMLSKHIFWNVSADEIKLITKNTNILYKIKNWIKDKSSKNTYLSLFVLGENNLNIETKQSYQLNGVSHLFAISGMHISLFVSIIFLILKKFIKNENISKIIISLFLCFYLFLTNFSISVIRASLLTIFIYIKQIFKLDISNLKLLLFLFLICISFNPYYIYQVGFIFTFIITFSILLFQNNISKYHSYFSKLLILSFITFLVSIPILIYNFFEVNFLTPILNLIFIPFVTFLIFPLALLSFVFPFLLPLFEFFTSILEQLSLFLNKINFFIIPFSKPSIIVIIIYYLLIYLTIKFFFKKKYYFIFILIIVLFVHYNIAFLNISSKVAMLDVNQGDSILIELNNNKGNILIDTGGILNKSFSTTTIIPYLKSIGIHSLDYLILSHGDYDHMGEAINLVNNFKVKNVIFNNDTYNTLETELIKLLEKKKIKYYKGLKELNIGNNKLYFLNTKELSSENDNSNVIYFKLNNYKFLFMGDAGLDREKDILSKYNLENIDFIKIGHHGSNTSSSKYFVENIKPKNCLISVGKKNRYGHPKESVINILDDYCDIYRTDIFGSVEITITEKSYRIKTYSS